MTTEGIASRSEKPLPLRVSQYRSVIQTQALVFDMHSGGATLCAPWSLSGVAAVLCTSLQRRRQSVVLSVQRALIYATPLLVRYTFKVPTRALLDKCLLASYSGLQNNTSIEDPYHESIRFVHLREGYTANTMCTPPPKPGACGAKYYPISLFRNVCYMHPMPSQLR